MARTPLYTRHSQGLAATYADVENHALAQKEVISGTPGSVVERTNASGARFYARQYYDHEGRKRDRYIAGPVGSPDTEALAASWRERIRETNDVISSVRLLVREGYLAIGPKQFAALAPMCAHGLFEAGAVLVGTYAYSVAVNRLGIRAAAYSTEDIDLARPGKLAIDELPAGGILEVLRESGIDFVDVPAFPHGEPTACFKERGRSRLKVDLLVPARGTEATTEFIPELKAHATALPYLRYLLGETQPGVVMSNHGVAAVRIPIPERFAIHKLIVSQLRVGRGQRSLKDRRQAAMLIAALGEDHPGALEAAFARTPLSVRRHVRKSLEALRGELEPHPMAWEEMARAAKIATAE